MNDRRRRESSNTVMPEGSAGSVTMLGRLQELLQRQLALVRQGHLAAAVALFEETDQCVRHIADTRGLEVQRATEQWQGIERLYQELSVALTAQRAEVSAALDTMRRGKQVLQTYGGHLSPV